MFNIEDKYDDLVELLNTNGLRPPTDIGQMAEELEGEIGTMADALKGLYRDMREAGNCDVQAMFGHIDGVELLGDEALLVVENLLSDLCFDFQRQIEGMTKYDRVNLD